MTDQVINNGDIVLGLDQSELVEIRQISPFGNKYLIAQEELSRLKKVRGSSCAYDGEPENFLLGAEAERIKIAYQFDPLFAVNSSIVDSLPHQVEAVYTYLLPLPRIRFLLADDTGAGKTIMTGLLLKELLFRGVIKKILIVTPGGLTRQWQEEELQEKFGLYARLVNSPSFEADPGQFSQHKEGTFVVSIDFLARNEGCLKAAEQTRWDIVIVDEAHKLSAYEYGEKLEESERYKAIKALSKRTDHLLFLTATPHRGRKDTFRRLLQLLDEDLFQKDKHVIDRVQEQTEQYNSPFDTKDENSISRARNRFFLRRLKEEMVDWDSTQLFKPRHTKTVGYELTPEEKVLYDSVTQYVRSKRKEAKAQRKRNVNVELTLMVMQRRLASSLYAITRTLENRLNALNEVLAILRDSRRTEAEKKRILNMSAETDDPRSIEEFESLTDNEKGEIEKKICRQVLTGDVTKIEEERDEVEKLHQLAASLKNHEEAKFSELRKVLDSSDVIRSDEEKLLIFTEHKDTMQSLAKKLEDRGYSVTVIHGGMDVDARKCAQREFRKKTKIMVATDAAGEGINLQFCRYLINWDIPWNPNRLEQRMGRIHRYGQKDDVWVYNLVAQNTREGAVLQRVLSKLDIMRDQMGSDRVYDVIDEWLEGVPLAELMQKALDNDDTTELTEKLNEATTEKAEALIALQKKTSLASRLNLRVAQELRDKSDERRLQPLFIQRFFERAWIACGGTIRKDDHFPVWHISRTPTALFEIASKRRVALSEHYDYPIVFDKQFVSIASKVSIPDRTKLMGPGHPLFNILIEWAIAEAHYAFAHGTVLIDPNIGSPQKIWLTRSVIRDGREDRQKNIAHNQLTLIVLDHMGLRVTSPSYLLNCLPAVPAEGGVDPATEDRAPEEIQMHAYEEITEKLLVKVSKERTEECKVRRDYLNTAFQDLILDLQEELNDFQQQNLYGDDTAEETEKLRKRIEELKLRKIDRMKELDLMLNLSGELPEILSQALIVSSPIAVTVDRGASSGVPMKRDDEVEAIAMDISMRHERTRGWNPVDVSKEGEHYDIRSEAPDGDKRFIEVKGRSETGAIILTGPELDKLRQLGTRAWLYVVTFCKSDRPKLRIIQDPVPKLNPEMLYRQVQFLVVESDWASQGEDAE